MSSANELPVLSGQSDEGAGRPKERMKRRSFKVASVHLIRLAIVLGLILMIRSPRPPLGEIGGTPELSSVQNLLPHAHSIAPEPGADGLWDVFDADGKVVARAARTLPMATDVVGYRGPSESLILFDRDLRIIGVSLLASTDTQEHVDAVLRDEFFFDQFRDWSWDGPPKGETVDGVSSATLTSLAIAGGVLKRIGGDKPSLVFGQPLEIDEVTDWFPNGKKLRQTKASTYEVLDENGEQLGTVLRTGPLSDSIVGYQGPTEMLLRISDDAEPKIESARIRKSFDNEPYVDYVRTEYGFWPLFQDKTIKQLSQLDIVAEEVEGVSGATMTSMAVAETLVATAGAHLSEPAIADAKDSGWLRDQLSDLRFSIADVATMVILIAGLFFRRMGWFQIHWLRKIWLILVVIVIGWFSGNLISLALVAGWGAEGIAWQLAPALALVALIALMGPPATKSNPYCNHICPHGAIQQLIKPSQKSRRKWSLPPWLSRPLMLVPGATLVIAYICLVIVPKTDLSSWEPFHAYLINITGWSALVFAVLTLVFAAFVPMGYCRFGCPTGRLLDYLRRKATSDRIRPADGVAMGLLVFAWWMGK